MRSKPYDTVKYAAKLGLNQGLQNIMVGIQIEKCYPDDIPCASRACSPKPRPKTSCMRWEELNRGFRKFRHKGRHKKTRL